MKRNENKIFMQYKMGKGGIKCRCCNWTRVGNKMHKHKGYAQAMKGQIRMHNKIIVKKEMES